MQSPGSYPRLTPGKPGLPFEARPETKDALVPSAYVAPNKHSPFSERSDLAQLAKKAKRTPSTAVTRAATTPAAPPGQNDNLPIPRSHLLTYENVRDRLLKVIGDTQTVYLETAQLNAALENLSPGARRPAGGGS